MKIRNERRNENIQLNMVWMAIGILWCEMKKSKTVKLVSTHSILVSIFFSFFFVYSSTYKRNILVF